MFHFSKGLLGLAVLAASAILSSSAHAQAGVLGPAANWNVLVRQNFTGINSDVEGRVAVGGNLDVQNYSIASKMNGFTGTALQVDGDFKWNNGQVFFGDARTGDATPTTSGFTVLNGSLLPLGGPSFIPAAMNDLSVRSNFWTTLPVNGTTNFQFGGLTLSGGTGDLRVFNVSGSNLAAANSFTINAPSTATVIVNVSGTSTQFKNAGFSLQGGVSGSKVLLNFSQATSLEFGGIGIFGSVVAPNANVTFNNGQINGQLVANSFNGTGEMHILNFDGAAPVPEPATMVALSAGLLALARKRKKA